MAVLGVGAIGQSVGVVGGGGTRPADALLFQEGGEPSLLGHGQLQGGDADGAPVGGVPVEEPLGLLQIAFLGGVPLSRSTRSIRSPGGFWGSGARLTPGKEMPSLKAPLPLVSGGAEQEVKKLMRRPAGAIGPHRIGGAVPRGHMGQGGLQALQQGIG